ncbi:MAG: LamG-like jellyroll fold domain-containing protein [Luteolibacter sp.]
MKSKSRKVLLCGLMIPLLPLIAPTASATQLYKWDFTSGTLVPVTGGGVGGGTLSITNTGATAATTSTGGVSGNATDGTLDLSSTNYSSGNPVATVTSTLTSVPTLTAMTVTGWIKAADWANSSGQNARILELNSTLSGNDGDKLYFSCNAGNLLQIGINSNGGGSTEATGGTFPTSGTSWVFVAFTWDSTLPGGTNLAVYRGSATATAAQKGASFGNYVTPMTGVAGVSVGNRNNGTPSRNFVGQLDDLRIYDTALTAAQIEAIRAESAPPPPPAGVPSYWKGSISGAWNAANWTSDLAGTVVSPLPTNGTASAIFAATSPSNLANTLLTANQNVRSLRFNTQATTVGIGGTNSLTIGDSGIDVAADAGQVTINTTGQVILGANQIWRNQSASPFNVASVISGAFNLTTAGPGVTFLSGNNLQASTSVDSGTLKLGHAHALGADSVVLDNAGTVDLNGFNTTLGGLTGGGIIHNSSASACTLTLDMSENSNYSCKINDGPGGVPVSLIKRGPADVTSSNGSSSGFTGSVSIEDGQFIANQPNFGGAPTTSSLGNLQVPGRTITITSPGSLRLTNNNIFGNANADPLKLPEIIVNATTMSSGNYNLIGNITLNASTLTQSAYGGNADYQGYQFGGAVKVIRDPALLSASYINGTAGNHLSSNTVFNVADATGDGVTVDDLVDLTVSTPLRNPSGDFGYPAAIGGLTKTGLGTLELSGNNTYTGDTTVTAGVLAVNGTSIADTNKLVLNGGKVDPSGTTEVVGTLCFGATQQSAGTWGATDSGADHIDNTHFTGSGVVSVTTGPVGGYTAWAGANGATGQAVDQDHDNDGVKNGIEYFMGQTGSTFTPNPAPVGGNVTWPMGATYSGVYGTDYEVQSSADLVTWTQVPIGTGDNTVTVTAATSVVYHIPTGGKRFVRLVVKN